MENISLTFNETTYNFNFCVGKNTETNEKYGYYKIYINGELHKNHILEEVVQIKGNKLFILYWKGFGSSVFISNPNDLEEIVKVITYINKNK